MSVLKNHPFRLLFVGQLTSSLGDVMFKLALFWYVQDTMGNPIYLVWLGLAITLPQFLAFMTGTLADQFERTKVMIVSDLIRCMLVLALAVCIILDQVSFLLIAVSVFLMSIFTNMFSPASRAFVSQLLDDEDLAAGNGLMDATFRFSTILSTMLGAVLITTLDVSWIFLFNVFTFTISLVTLLLIQKYHAKHPLRNSDQTIHVSFYRDWVVKCKEGFSFIKKFVFLKYTVPSGIVVNIFFSIFLFLAPAWSEEILHSGAFGFSVLEFAIGLGMLSGSLSAGYFSKRLRLKSAVSFSFGMQAVVLLYPLFMSLPFNALVLFFFGFGNGLSNSLSSTILQRLVPNHLQGRVFGSLATILGGIVPLGTLISGFFVSQFGVYYTYIIGSIGIAAGSFYLMFVFYTEIWNKKGQNKGLSI